MEKTGNLQTASHEKVYTSPYFSCPSTLERAQSRMLSSNFTHEPNQEFTRRHVLFCALRIKLCTARRVAVSGIIRLRHHLSQHQREK